MNEPIKGKHYENNNNKGGMQIQRLKASKWMWQYESIGLDQDLLDQRVKS